MGDFADLRGQMVRRQIEARGIFDPIILDAFREVPREEFVAEEYRQWAYDDNPLPIEAGQTISQPYIVALMIEAAGIKAGDKVLEVGAGSGYAAAVMSRIARKGVRDRAAGRTCPMSPATGWRALATTTSRSSKGTARADIRAKRRSTPFSPRRAGATSRDR